MKEVIVQTPAEGRPRWKAIKVATAPATRTTLLRSNTSAELHSRSCICK